MVKKHAVKSSFNYYDGFEEDVRFYADRCEDDDIVEYVAGCIEDNDHPTESPEEFESLMRAVHAELKNQSYFKQPWQVNQSRKPIKSSWFSYDVEINMNDGNVYHETYEGANRNEIKKDIENDFPNMKNFTVLDFEDISDKYIDNSRKSAKSEYDYWHRTPQQLKFDSEYNDWFIHFQMNLDRVPQYLEGVEWFDNNKNKPWMRELEEDFHITPVGDREIAAFYNALKSVGAINQWGQPLNSSRKPIQSAKKTVTREEVEIELNRVLTKRKVSLDDETYEETVEYILSFWDDEFPPESVKEGVSEWYNDTKTNFPDVFTGKKVASALYRKFIKSRLIKSNTVTNTLPPTIDNFLQDLAQECGTFNYSDISKFAENATDDKLKQLKKLRREWREVAEYNDEEGMNDIGIEVAKVIKSSRAIKSNNEELVTVQEFVDRISAEYYDKQDFIDWVREDIHGSDKLPISRWMEQWNEYNGRFVTTPDPTTDDVDQFEVSVGECGQDGVITVRKGLEDRKWHGSDGKTFMGYLTPEDIVYWYSKDYGSAWLDSSRKAVKSSKYYTSYNNWKHNTSVLPMKKELGKSFFEDGTWDWDSMIAVVGTLETDRIGKDGLMISKPAVIFGSKGKYDKLEKGTGLFNDQSWNDIGYFSFSHYSADDSVFDIPNARYFVLK